VLQISALLLHSWGGRVATRFDSRIDDDLVPLFVKITKIFILLIAALLVMSKFGIEIGPLIASLGVVGFAVGFAVKDTLSNIIGGIILILDSSFSVGDKVMIDGDTGIVREVGLRNTKLLTYDNEVIVIPNGELMNKKFKNYALPDPKIRVIVKFGVVYGSDADRVERVVLDAVSSIQGVESNPEPVVTFEQMGDFSLDFQAKFWIPMWSDQYMKRIEATKKIYNALNQAGIGIPFPTHTVYLEKS
jgi:MscS family membrane protein